MLINIPGAYATSVLALTLSHSRPLPPEETLQDQQVGLAQGPMKLALLLLVLVCMRFCVPLLRVKSVSCSQAFKAKCSGGLSSQYWISRLGGA